MSYDEFCAQTPWIENIASQPLLSSFNENLFRQLISVKLIISLFNVNLNPTTFNTLKSYFLPQKATFVEILILWQGFNM